MNKKMKLLSRGLIFSFLSLVVVFGAVVLPNNTPAKATPVSELRSQAAALQAQINENTTKAKALAKEADSLKRKIAEFDLQIAGVSAQIELTNVKIAELEESLKQAQIELDRQKELLKTAVRALYKKGDASSFELLVGSSSFSQFVNEQDYLERLKDGIQKSTEKVIELKLQIKAQKEEQEKLLVQQEEQKKALDASRAERQDVLNYTKGQESTYKQMAENLRQQQLEINRQIFAQSNAQLFTGDPSKGGYPWDNQGYPCSGVDPWGMCYRQCVSYTAFKVVQSGRHMAQWGFGGGYGGNAQDWLSNARIDGIPYDQNPRVGDVGITQSGPFGHAIYVEQVYDDGRIYISQYNYISGSIAPGRYSEAIMNPDSSWYFIHFP